MHAPRIVDEIKGEAQAALEDARRLVPKAATQLVDGRPDEKLLKIVEEEGATLVAVGSYGHGRGVGIAVGSAATRMLQDAPCSVLVARADDPRLSTRCDPGHGWCPDFRRPVSVSADM